MRESPTARIVIVMSIIFMFLLTLFSGCAGNNEKSITIFAGSASKPALEEAASVFEEETGIDVILNFSGSGTMLSQMKITRSGDLYIPGSPDYMKMAEADGSVEPDSVVIISYLVPAILVQQGNPENIQALTDLAEPGIEIGIGNPEAVCVGLYAYEILEFNNVVAEINRIL